jgi:glutamate synthase (NADPH/NADH) large chain
MNTAKRIGFPEKIGLYDPANEKDSCGVGFVAHIKGQRSHQTVLDADQVLRSMDHRGACGCEPNTGDGAGILTALPYEFLARVAREELRAELPPRGQFGAGLVFLPTDARQRARCKEVVGQLVERFGQRLVGWRKVPTCADKADIGPTARCGEPYMEQVLIAAGRDAQGQQLADDALERRLYLIRKRASHDLRGAKDLPQAKMFYICSLSAKVMIYKGMLTPCQLLPYFPDLSAEDYLTHLAMVHSRFSTNTFPSWDRAQPNRFMCHNGEINTLKGNVNWMRAREGIVQSSLFRDELHDLFPIVEPDCSDSGNFDNTSGVDHDDDSRSVAEARNNAGEQACILRISFLLDGTVGWTGVDCFHGWALHRRRARSKWSAAQSLLSDSR